MDTVRTAETAPARGRAGSLLALALAASTALTVLTPFAGSPSATPLVDVVVTSTSTGVGAVADAVRAAGGVVRDALPLTGGVSAQLPADAVLAPSFSVVKNAPLSLASKDVAASDRTATAVREALRLGAPKGEGAGITIAVVDTGVDNSSGEFGTRVEHVDVSGSYDDGESRDPYGHGTFVAGIAAGGGAENARYAGVAPGAKVLDVRVADEEGATDLITVLRGLEAAAEAGVDVVNLSLSSGSPLPYQIDPLTIALDRLWAAGVVVVVPTGNDGPKPGSITSPGSDPTLLTVGSLDERNTSGDLSDDTVSGFSGRGPTPQGVAKPDLVTAGTSVVSVRAHGSYVDSNNASARVGGNYFRGSGTSFATSATAGAAATLLQHRDLSPDQIKTLFRSTAYRASGLSNPHAAGAGGLDLAAALTAPAPQVSAPGFDAPPAGDEQAWRDFLQALMDDDKAAAAAAWSRISPAGHRWGGHRWGGHRWGGHRWGANSWSGHRWAGDGVSAEEWEMRFWAGHRWAGHRWASDAFVGHRWAGHRWGGDDWQGHRWGGEDWAGHRWAGHRWAGHRWAGHRWAAQGWVASRWS